MRQKKAKRQKGSDRSGITRLPLTEGTIPLNGHGGRDWTSLSNRELVAYARNFINRNAIRSISDFQIKDPGLESVLRKRGLLRRVLNKATTKIFNEKRSPGFFSNMDDGEMLEYATRLVRTKGLESKKELQREDNGLYQALCKRGLLEKLELGDKHTRWRDLNDDELVAFAQKSIEKKGISGRKEMYRKDGRLYDVLRRRGLLEQVRFKIRRMSWKSMNDGEIIAYSKEYLDANPGTGRGDLFRSNPSHYEALRRRNLLGEVGFDEKRICWREMSDKEILSLARKLVSERSIRRKVELKKADHRLYDTLCRRNLITTVFREVEKREETRAVQQVVNALKEFGDAP
jgi:hypothetical protein